MKKGITISVLVVTIVMMFVLVTTATVIGVRAIQTAAYEEFLSKIQRVANDVNEYVIVNKSLPITSEIIAKEGLSNTFKAELKRNNDDTNNLFIVDMSKLRTESVNIGKGSVENMDVFVVAENSNNVYYLKGVEYRGKAYHGMDITNNLNENGVPLKWEKYVVAMVDDVPIPKGFVASGATGENTRNGGLVIYEGTEQVNDANVETAKRTRNQYVWVPVDNFSKFIRQNFGTSSNITNKFASGYWEVVLDKATNMPLSAQDVNYVSQATLEEVQELYSSVKEYEGFYIARYEAGTDNQRTSESSLVTGSNVYSMMGKIPYTYIAWGTSMADDTSGAVEVARSIYQKTNTNYGVVSTLTYGVQWDRTLAWWLETRAKDGLGNPILSVTDSVSYGNYSNHEIEIGDLNNGAKYAVYSNKLSEYKEVTQSSTKVEGTKWALTTGALKVARVNNIYDMAGNMWERTMEGYSTHRRIERGGSMIYDGTDFSVYRRNYNGEPNTVYDSYGFRPSLYIKQQ